VWCTLMRNRVIGPFIFDEPVETGDSFLAVIESTALFHVPLGTVPVTWCTTSLLLSCSCFSGQGVS
jgi:hypothetical protein